MIPQTPPPGYVGYPPYGPPPVATQNGMGITALVLGILSIPAGIVVVGGVLGILAIVFGIIGIKKANGGAASNKGMAIGGLVTGIVGLLIALFVLGIGVFAYKVSDNCRTQLGPNASDNAIAQCVQDKVTN